MQGHASEYSGKSEELRECAVMMVLDLRATASR
jgi:hypothetical protein